MIVFSYPTVLGADNQAFLYSTFPGCVGTEELLHFATERLGLRGEWIENAAKPEERFVIRGRTVRKATEAGAAQITTEQAAEVMRYKRYLYAESPEDRVERRLVARYVLALVDLGVQDLDLAAEAAADTYMLEHVVAAAELVEAMERFSGGYATWRDETGTTEQCGRCGVPGAIELDEDLFYRCEKCRAEVREISRLAEIDQRVMNLLTQGLPIQ